MWRESNRATTTAASIRAESCRAPDAYCPPDAAGGGQCPINFCGQAKVGLPANQFPQSGADSLCGVRDLQGRPRAVDRRRVPAGLLRPPTPSGLAFGAGLLARSGAGDALRGRFAVHHRGRFPQARSARGCAATTPTARRTRAASSVPTPVALADGRRPVIGMCTPESKIAGKVCVREADCDAGQGCVHYGGRTSLRICRAGGAKSLGTACAAPGECRSGECFDRDCHVPRRPEPRLLLGRVQREQRLRPRSALRAAGRRQQRHRRAIRSTIWWSASAGRCSSPSPATGVPAATRTASTLQNGSDGCDVDARPLLSQGRAARLRLHERDGLPGGRRVQHRARASPAATARRSAATPAATSGVNALPGHEQHLRAARRPRRADLGLLREVRAGRERLQPRERAATRANR